jgi:hypothetical protein
MKIDKLESLQFKKLGVEFDDGRTMYTAFIKGKFTRFDILNKMESLAEKLKEKGKNGYIGVSAHYREPNGWLPAIYCNINKTQKLFNPSDSTTTIEYKDIDGCYFYVAEMPEGKELKQKMHKVQKSTTEVQNMFIKK